MINRILKGIALSGALFLCTAAMQAQTRHTVPLSLEEAMRLASGETEEVLAAQAGVMRAEGNQTIARSQYLPQITASLGYTRTLISQYSGITTSTSGSGDTGKAASSAASLFSNLPFGQANQWTLGINLSQNIYTGGRLEGQSEAAEIRRHSAEIDVTAAKAQLLLNVAQAYYDALLTNELVAISMASITQADTIFRQAELGFKVGERPEFDMLRARVARDNQVPGLIQNQNNRQLAYMRLKQLLNLPLGDSIQLTSGVNDILPRFVSAADTAADLRAPVLQAMDNISANEAALKIARSERLPVVTLASRFAPVAYPKTIFPSSLDQFHTDWTVSFNVAMPLYLGGRTDGDIEVAQAGIEQARSQLQQVREAAQLDAQSAANDLAQAQATLASTQSTVEQANRADAIAQVRFHEGISTALELNDAQLQQQQALANQARAQRNYQVARVKLALIRDLPLGGGATSTASQAAAQQAQAPAQVFTTNQGSGQGAVTGGSSSSGQ